MTRGPLDTRIQALGLWLWPLAAVIAGWLQIHKRFTFPVHPDATYTYLPAARALLDQGWTFLLSPQSYRVAPLGYLWPALWGAEPGLIRIANGGLWLGCVFFLWKTGLLMGGARTGAVALLLWSAHPELPRYFATELTEPIFLFGVFGWTYFFASICIEKKPNATVISLAALMLTLTLLSRPVLQIIAPALLLACVFYIFITNQNQKNHKNKSNRIAKPLTISLALALIIPGIWIIKNGLSFGLWGLATGAGTGLYLGTNPLFQGTEPAFLGFDYDANLIALLGLNDGDHLSIAADKVLRNAAIWQIQSMQLLDAVAYFSRKLWWWLLHHPSQIDVFGSALRKLRIFELLTIASFFCLTLYEKTNNKPTKEKEKTTPHEFFFLALLAVFFLMLLQLLPILYNSRYSSALLDPWLIPATSYAFTRIICKLRINGLIKKDLLQFSVTAKGQENVFSSIFIALALLISAPIIFNALKKEERTNIDPEHMGQVLSRLQLDSPTKTYGMEERGHNSWVTTTSPAALQAPVPQISVDTIVAAEVFNGLWQTDLVVTPPEGGRCNGAEVSYQTNDGLIHQSGNRRPLLLKLKGDGRVERLVTHANLEMRPRQPGSLRTVIDCPAGTVVQWESAHFLESRHPWNAIAHLKHQTQGNP